MPEIKAEQTLTDVRIVVASPSDVSEERDALSQIVDQLNSSEAKTLGFRLHLWRWETDTYPGFHQEGPQGLIDELMKIEGCDIVVGIFWKRFGTPVADANSGTEHELRRAIAAWKEFRRPHVMLYFNANSYSPKTAAELDQWKSVFEFRKEMQPLALLGIYKGVDEFKAGARNHLIKYLETRSKQEAELMHQEALDRLSYNAEVSRSRWIHNALDFFEDRLSEAFPGVRGLQVFRGQAAVERLQRLLHDPLKIPTDHGYSAPLWWWHGSSDLEINKFRVLDASNSRCLLGREELIIDEAAVYRDCSRPYRSFVYVSTNADQPTGVQELTEDEIKRQLELRDYASEAVAFWNDRYITYEEYDDGYAEIDGKIAKVDGADVRIRYLTPYNLFITSITSVFNSLEVDEAMETICKSLLSGNTKLKDVVKFVDGLQLTGRIREAYFLDD